MQNRNDISTGTVANNPGTVNPVPDLKQEPASRDSNRAGGTR
jgi:hypothetical protein